MACSSPPLYRLTTICIIALTFFSVVLSQTLDPLISNHGGDESCRCLLASEVNPIDVTSIPSGFDPNLDYMTYGIGCALHDINTTACTSGSGNQCDVTGISTGIPVPADCTRSWCSRPWCFVDARSCQLLHKPSILLGSQTRFYSYATCGHMDSFTDAARLDALQGQVLKVGYNSNTGGWSGAYNPDGHFATTNGWYGPTVNFIIQAALRGGFKINITKPPEWLSPLAQQFFGSSSPFDLCIYATTLGYLDFCVADYTITDKRASSATFFQLQNKPLYMIAFIGKKETSFESFIEQFMSIFEPFTLGVWCIILFVVLPLMGLLMVFHEYGAQGGSYPEETSVVVKDPEGSQELKSKKIPVRQHIARALYASILSFFQGSYDQTIVTLGGKLNLLGISFFILIIITTYTSNLAAILTQDAQSAGVSNIDDAIRAGYTFCATRKTAEIVTKLYDIKDRIVVDPEDIGGDGLPGFNCDKCNARTRVFDFMASPNPDRTLYCDAAITNVDGLEDLQRFGEHCNKSTVGGSLAYGLSGIPVYSGVAEPLVSLLVALRNEGLMRKELNDAMPSSKCPIPQEEGEALTIEQLTAVWVITGSFALLGLVTKFSHRFVRKRRTVKKSKLRLAQERSMIRYDQWGTPLELDCPQPQPAKNNGGSGENFKSSGHDDVYDMNEDTSSMSEKSFWTCE